MVVYLRQLFQEVEWVGSGEQCVSYDTQFNLGDYYASTLTVRDPRMESKQTGTIPVVPAFLVIHDRKFAWDHNLALSVITMYVPELKRKRFIGSSDDEFTKPMVVNLPNAIIVKDENHLLQKIGRAIERRGGNLRARNFMKDEFRQLIRCTSRAMYEKVVKLRKEKWEPKFRSYMERYILPEIDRSALWTAREVGWKRVEGGNIPANIFDSQQAESFNAKFAKRCGLEQLSYVDIAHTWRDTQRAFLYERGRCLMGNLGEHRMRERYIREDDTIKGRELIAKMTGPSFKEVEERVKKLAEQEKFLGLGLGRVQGRHTPAATMPLSESLVDLEEEDLMSSGEPSSLISKQRGVQSRISSMFVSMRSHLSRSC